MRGREGGIPKEVKKASEKLESQGENQEENSSLPDVDFKNDSADQIVQKFLDAAAGEELGADEKEKIQNMPSTELDNMVGMAKDMADKGRSVNQKFQKNMLNKASKTVENIKRERAA